MEPIDGIQRKLCQFDKKNGDFWQIRLGKFEIPVKLYSTMKSFEYTPSNDGGPVQFEKPQGVLTTLQSIPSNLAMREVIANIRQLLGPSQLVTLRLHGIGHSVFSICSGMIFDPQRPVAKVTIQKSSPYDPTDDEEMPLWVRDLGRERRKLLPLKSQEEQYIVTISPEAPSFSRQEDFLLFAASFDGILLSFEFGRSLIEPSGDVQAAGSEDLKAKFGDELAATVAAALLRETANHGRYLNTNGTRGL